MTQSMRAQPSEKPASPASPRDTAHLSKRARFLKGKLATHLRAVRVEHDLDRHDVYDKPSFVSLWENPEKPHAPNAMHVLDIADDERSLVYARAVHDFVDEELKRAEAAAKRRNPAQLSLLDLIANANT